jgi:hypothetical protein
MNSDQMDKLSGFLRKNIVDLVMIIAITAYLFLDFFNLGVSIEMAWYKIGIILVVNLAFGYALTDLMADKGIEAGRASDKYISSLRRYGEEKEKTDPFCELAPKFCESYNDRKMENEKKSYFRAYGLKYEKRKQYEEEIANFQKFTKKEKKANPLIFSKWQLKAIKRADRRVKIYEIDENYLFSLSSKKGYKASSRAPMDIPGHILKREITKSANKIITSIAFTFVAFEFVLTPSWANFLSSLLKVAVWLLFGALSYWNEYNFITGAYLQDCVIPRTDRLIEFRNEYGKGQLTEEPKKEEVKEAPTLLGGEARSLTKEIAQNVLMGLIK